MKCKDPEVEAPYYFKGHFLCLICWQTVKGNLNAIISKIEEREKRTIPDDEEIGINQPRLAHDEFDRVIKLRGTHFTITKEELRHPRTLAGFE